MIQSIKMPWFSVDRPAYTGSEPCFYHSEEFPWVKKLEDNWNIIREELEEEIARSEDEFEPYMNKEIMSGKNKWKTLGLMFWTMVSKTNCRKFPKTWAIIKDIPHLSAASFNVLESNTTITPHIGNTDAIIRCHLGLNIPDVAPKCAFRVGDETRSWENGKLMMFCDAHLHTAWNNTAKDRYILLIDVFKPDYADKKTFVSGKVLGQIHQQVGVQKHCLLSWLCRLPPVDKLVHFVYRLFWQLKVMFADKAAG